MEEWEEITQRWTTLEIRTFKYRIILGLKIKAPICMKVWSELLISWARVIVIIIPLESMWLITSNKLSLKLFQILEERRDQRQEVIITAEWVITTRINLISLNMIETLNLLKCKD
jgi:hypothetical protein